MVLMVYTAVDQVLVVNPCGADGLHSAVDQVLVANPCGADVSYPANTKYFLTCFKKSYENVLQHLNVGSTGYYKTSNRNIILNILY